MPMNEYEHYQMQEAIQRDQTMNQAIVPQSAILKEQQAQSQAILITETNPKKIIDQIELLLRNQERHPSGKIISLGPPHLSEIGINRALFLLRAMVTQGSILSHLEEKKINQIVIELGDAVADDLAQHWRKYGIKDKTMLDYIHNIIIFNIYLALMRSMGQNEKNWLKGITVETINAGRSSLPEKKGGFFDRFRL